MSVLSERIAKARERAGLSKTELARLIGVKPPSVTNYEQGKRKPTVETLSIMSEVLGVTSDWLIGNEPDNELSDEEALSKYSPFFISTLTTPEARDRAIRCMKRLLHNPHANIDQI